MAYAGGSGTFAGASRVVYGQLLFDSEPRLLCKRWLHGSSRRTGDRRESHSRSARKMRSEKPAPGRMLSADTPRVAAMTSCSPVHHPVAQRPLRRKLRRESRRLSLRSPHPSSAPRPSDTAGTSLPIAPSVRIRALTETSRPICGVCRRTVQAARLSSRRRPDSRQSAASSRARSRAVGNATRTS